jgi:histidinol-phosphate phosphatase family protein
VSRRMRPRQAVIFAGGRGTRLGPLTDHMPKPMVAVAGRPFLEYLLELLSGQGFDRVLLLLGYRAEAIPEHFGDGSDWGVHLDYHVTPPETQTLTRMRAAMPLLDDVVLIAYCDNYVPFCFEDMWDRFRSSRAIAQVTAYGNDDGFTRSNMLVTDSGRVLAYDPSRGTTGLNRVDIGFATVDLARLGRLPEDDRPFEHAVYPGLAATGALRAHVTYHRYYGIGSAARLPAAERFFARRPAVILDRDGVLNRRPPRASYVVDPGDFRWLDGALDALRRFTDNGFTIIVITNQAGIARGLMTPGQLAAVHRRLLADATAAGARIDRIYHCPHGWHDGCSCRKPAPGMLFRAQREFDLDLSRTVFVGDDERDRIAAQAAGCRYQPATAGRSLLQVARELTGGP